MIRRAMNSVFHLGRANPEWNLKAIMTIHDEGVYYIRQKYANVASIKIKECFESAVKLNVPVIADCEIGTNYAEIK